MLLNLHTVSSAFALQGQCANSRHCMALSAENTSNLPFIENID